MRSNEGQYWNAPCSITRSPSFNTTSRRLVKYVNASLSISVTVDGSVMRSNERQYGLIDEEGVWWQGKKKYQPPSISESEQEAAGIDERGDTNNSTEVDDSTTVLSVRLGGYRVPVITTKQLDQSKEESKAPPQTLEEDTKPPSQQPQQPKQHTPGSTLGILIPLMDMIDHKDAHPVQWESVYSKAPRSIPPKFYYTPPPQGEPSVESIPPSAVYCVHLLRNQLYPPSQISALSKSLYPRGGTLRGDLLYLISICQSSLFRWSVSAKG